MRRHVLPLPLLIGLLFTNGASAQESEDEAAEQEEEEGRECTTKLLSQVGDIISNYEGCSWCAVSCNHSWLTVAKRGGKPVSLSELFGTDAVVSAFKRDRWIREHVGTARLAKLTSVAEIISALSSVEALEPYFGCWGFDDDDAKKIESAFYFHDLVGTNVAVRIALPPGGVGNSLRLETCATTQLGLLFPIPPTLADAFQQAAAGKGGLLAARRKPGPPGSYDERIPTTDQQVRERFRALWRKARDLQSKGDKPKAQEAMQIAFGQGHSIPIIHDTVRSCDAKHGGYVSRSSNPPGDHCVFERDEWLERRRDYAMLIYGPGDPNQINILSSIINANPRWAVPHRDLADSYWHEGVDRPNVSERYLRAARAEYRSYVKLMKGKKLEPRVLERCPDCRATSVDAGEDSLRATPRPTN